MELGSYVADKLTAAVSGFAGGASIMSFIRPKTIGEAFARGGTSTGTAIIFAGPLINLCGLKSGWDTQLAAGFVIGFTAYSLLGAVANFLRKHEESDIVEMVQAARGDIEPRTKPAEKKVRAKRRKEA